MAAREKRAARLVEVKDQIIINIVIIMIKIMVVNIIIVKVGDLSSIPLGKISDVASNVSIAYKEDIWQNDMIYKDQVQN